MSIEVKRLLFLYNSIKKFGYQRTNKFDGDIGTDILVNELGKWRFLVSPPPQHRASVLSALGFEKIPVRVKSLIYKNESKCWPNVRSNLYTNQGAPKVFDEDFSGRSISPIK